jgi:hypothetical protein
MVDIVRALPPSDGKTTAKVCNKGANQGVGYKVASDPTMAGVMSCKHDLLLAASQHYISA